MKMRNWKKKGEKDLYESNCVNVLMRECVSGAGAVGDGCSGVYGCFGGNMFKF